VNFHKTKHKILAENAGLLIAYFFWLSNVGFADSGVILKCDDVFCSPGDSVDYVSVGLKYEYSTLVAGFQFDLSADPRYFTPLKCTPLYRDGIYNWLEFSSFPNDSTVRLITVDTSLAQPSWQANFYYYYHVNVNTPPGFYEIEARNAVVTNRSGGSLACELQSGTIIVANGDAYIKIEDDTVRVGQESVIIPITFVAKEGARTISFAIADSAGIFSFRGMWMALTSDWTLTSDWDSAGTITFYAHCEAPLRPGCPIAPNEIRTISLLVDINRNIAPGNYALVIREPFVEDALSSGASSVDAIAGCLTVIDSTSGLGTDPVIPHEMLLSQNYPNPFNLCTTIGFAVSQTGEVKLEIFNLLGQLVKTLICGEFTPGKYMVVWEGRSDNGLAVESGIYFLRLSAEERVITRKMLLIK
jgi:hypothetical protein